MRLTEAERETLKTAIQNLDENARVFLFGSRVDDGKTGGDIDVLIFSTCLTKQLLRKVKRRFCDQFGEQKIDLVLDSGKLETPFVRMIFPTAISL
ncbi:MAG: nucleotidyltransferase domain-containing protein [Methylococcales bacterium]|nr:nucleotidyltransferase domain-containing protein [Methylococcales bacterium]